MEFQVSKRFEALLEAIQNLEKRIEALENVNSSSVEPPKPTTGEHAPEASAKP